MSESSEGVPVPEDAKKDQFPKLNEFGEINREVSKVPKNPNPNVKSLDDIRVRLAQVSRQMNPEQLGRTSSDRPAPPASRPTNITRPK